MHRIGVATSHGQRGAHATATYAPLIDAGRCPPGEARASQCEGEARDRLTEMKDTP